MTGFITWLHLSDLHYCIPRTGWDATRVLTTLRNDLRKMEDEHGLTPDLIFFTGDAVFGQIGKDTGYNISEQFKGAANFFDQVRTAFRVEVPREKFFLVPGNHDINRDCISEDQTAWLDSQSDINKIISLIKDKPIQWKRYFERLHDYRTFLQEQGYIHLLRDPDRLIYALTQEVNGYRINIAGLNSVWSCSRDGEKGKIWMGGRWQVEHLLASLPVADLSIVLMHHPSNWLVESEDPHLGRQIERDFNFSLHGHEHQEWVVQTSNHTRIAAGSCYDRSDKSNGYNFVRVNLVTGTGQVWLRRYHSTGAGWVPEVIPNKTNNDGCWRLTGIPQIKPPASSASLGATEDNISSASSPLPLSDSNTSTTIPIRINRPFRFYGSDLRPVIDAWVGREQELAALDNMNNGVVAITGIGGQGKSTLVAKFLEMWISRNPEGFWDWRDCREEGERFYTQLVALIEHLTEGVITGKHLSEADTKAVVRYFFELVGDKSGVIVLDNVDYYVDQPEEKFSLGVGVLVQEALRVGHNLLFILTCRPRISYPSPRFLDIPLGGIDITEAIELFRLRGVKVSKSNQNEIEEIWTRTEGHPLWLNLIAVQISRHPQNAPNILQELRKGHIDDRTRSMFKALWKGLTSRQQIILRCMSEVTYPETIDSIRNFVGTLIKTPNHYYKSFSALKALSLVVERGSNTQAVKFDLHPLVRSFIRTEYPTEQDRLPYIQPILLFFARLFTGNSELSQDAPLEELQRWTAKAELELAADKPAAAVETLSLAADRLIARGFHEEFFRVAKLVLDKVDWGSIEMQDSLKFNNVVSNVISALVEHNRADEARQYLNRYEEACSSTTVARLRYCKVACYFEWFLGNYQRAIALGEEGAKLKAQSGIDTKQDPSITLALALRDSGKWDDALKIFAPDQSVRDILSEDHLASGKDAAFYGNIGRCLHLKGELAFALHCYVNSAELLNNASSSVDILNKGYAALWIGESLEGLGDYTSGYNFYRQAVNIWSQRSPLRVSKPIERLNNIRHLVEPNCLSITDDEVDAFCRKWILTYRKSHKKNQNS